MIDPKELMQGNYIKYLHSENEFSEVIGFDSENIMLNEITHDYVWFDECEPIFLTKEWLLDFDFKNDEISKDYWYRKEMRTFAKDRMYIYLPYGLFDSIAPCQYVNQLQNLFFSLTGKKLTLKDKS